MLQTGRMTGRRFIAVLDSIPAGGTGLRLPFDPKAVFGRARAPVRVTIGQHPPFRTTVMVYSGIAWIGLRKDQLAELNLTAGDSADLLVELDDAPRVVDVPPELAKALEADPEAAAAFEALSYTHRKEYARWVAEAKRDATRADRVAKTVQRLRNGIKPSF
jgi:Bacteriocin-protection, YdeI or OmpD-Associated/Domain of unknown function (DUF1905)